MDVAAAIEAVERVVLKKFNWWKSEYIAFVAFSDGDAERLIAAGTEHGNVFGDDDEAEDAVEEPTEAVGSSSTAVEEEEADEEDADDDKGEEDDDDSKMLGDCDHCEGTGIFGGDDCEFCSGGYY